MLAAVRLTMKRQYAKQTHTIVIGGGQAGLAIGYHLAKRGLPFQIAPFR